MNIVAFRQQLKRFLEETKHLPDTTDVELVDEAGCWEEQSPAQLYIGEYDKEKQMLQLVVGNG